MQGHCLCGAVTVTAPDHTHLDACHCGMCRRWGGGPALMIACGKDVTIEGEESLSLYRSSDWAERGFCSICGSHLFYRLIANGDHFVPAGLFQPDIGLQLEGQIFIDKKPPYYSFANSTNDLTEAEVFAQYASLIEAASTPSTDPANTKCDSNGS